MTRVTRPCNSIYMRGFNINAWVKISPEMMEDNSSMRLKHKIDEIQNEKFSAAENVKKSAVLQKTIRKVGTQMVNHDIECKSES